MLDQQKQREITHNDTNNDAVRSGGLDGPQMAAQIMAMA